MITQSEQPRRFATANMLTGWAGRLFRYDLRIAIHAASATFPYWRDRVLASAMLLVGAFALRTGLAERPWSIASWQAFGVGVVIGLAATRVIRARLLFHASDGPLAADALRRATRQRYILGWHAIGLVGLVLITIVARPVLLVVSVPGYVTGRLVAHAAGTAIPGLRFGGADARRHMLAALRHPAAAIGSVAILLVPLALAASTLDTGALAAITGVETAILMLALTAIDYPTVRILALTGHPPGATILRQGRNAILFLALAAPGALLALGPIPAATLAAVGAAALLLHTLRVLAYYVHRKPVADVVVFMTAAVTALTAFTAPIALPVVLLVALAHMYGRAHAKTWMLE